MSNTITQLERIRDLLSQDPPNHREAVRLAKNLLIHGACSQEQDALRHASLLLLEQLVLPALAGTREKQARVGRLIRQIRTARTWNRETMAAELREIGTWMTALGSRVDAPEPEPAFPAATVREALITLGGKTIQDSFPPGKEPHWPTLYLHLGAIIRQEHKRRAEWQREQEVLQTLLAKTTQTLADSCALIGADAGGVPLLLERLHSTEPITDWGTLQDSLLQAMQQFRVRSSEIRRRLHEAQDAVERSRVLIRHADWALMETRDERLVDLFTGLPNRFGLLARLEQTKQRADREGFALIAILLEEYAQIVQDLGRERVNRLMSSVAGRMVALMRPGDYLARYNDETFAIIAPKLTATEALALAGRWRDTLDRTRFELSDAILVVRTSYGVAHYEQGESTEKLLGLAIMAAQEAMNEGGARVRAVPSRPKPTPPPKRLFGMR